MSHPENGYPEEIWEAMVQPEKAKVNSTGPAQGLERFVTADDEPTAPAYVPDRPAPAAVTPEQKEPPSDRTELGEILKGPEVHTYATISLRQDDKVDGFPKPRPDARGGIDNTSSPAF